MLGFISGYAGAEALLARQSAEQGVAVPPVVLIIGYSIGMLIHLALFFLSLYASPLCDPSPL